MSTTNHPLPHPQISTTSHSGGNSNVLLPHSTSAPSAALAGGKKSSPPPSVTTTNNAVKKIPSGSSLHALDNIQPAPSIVIGSKDNHHNNNKAPTHPPAL